MPGIIEFRRAAKELFAGYLTHQSWKAHDGVFAPLSFETQTVRPDEGRSHSRSLRKLAGVRLSAEEASAVWPRLLEHKWYLGERLGRDVGLRVAAADFFENVQPPHTRPLRRTRGGAHPPRLPMMRSVGQAL